MRDYLRQLIRKALDIQAEKYGYKHARLEFSLEPPPRQDLGDYSTNAAILLAKQAGEQPVKVADEIRAALIGIKDVFEDISIAGGGFLNFTLSPQFLIPEFQKFDPARIGKPRNETILIEYSSPNIGKPLSIAHIRSTVIGDSLARIFKALGYRVITDNHLGDWGLQAGILVAAYKLWGKKPMKKISMPELLELYVQFNTEMKAHGELASKAKMETVLLQREDRKTFAIWKAIRAKSVREYRRLYRMLGVRFDYMLGESFYRKALSHVIADAVRAGAASESQGAIVIPLEANEPPLIIQKQDGGYLYATFDLATIRYRVRRWNPSRMLYVIANEQAQYLDQTFRAAEKLGWLRPGQAIHVKFGMIRGEDMKRLSTRGGKTILLEDVIREAAARARRIVEEKNPALPEREKENIARMVGVGALKYNDLSQNRNTDIVFDWNRMLDFQGNSAPYLQYTHARMRSILRKIGNRKWKIRRSRFAPPAEQEEIALMKKTLRFPEAVEDAGAAFAPNLLANYLWEFANLANTFYEKYPVLKAEPVVRAARLALIAKTAATIKSGLKLLGIEAPERV